VINTKDSNLKDNCTYRRCSKSYLFFLAFVFFIVSHGYAQDNQEIANQLIQIADEIYINSNAEIQARDAYVQVLDFDPDNVKANYMAGYLYLQTINKEKAVPYLSKVYEIDPEYTFDLFYQLGRAYQFALDFDNAKQLFYKYIELCQIESEYEGEDRIPPELAEKHIEECFIGADLVGAPLNYNITNVGPNINSEWPDYGPSVNQDETLIVFTSRRPDGNLNQDVFEDNFPYEEIFIATMDNDRWEKATNISDIINTPFFESSLTISDDGQELYIYLDENRGDVYFSEKINNDVWSKPVPIPGEVNTGNKETSVALSPDGNIMFFASDRVGSAGGLDIFYATRDKKENWVNVVNIGSAINTPGDDDFPFMESDGKTLYFSSTGHEGMGGYDIYKTVYDSASQTWIKPVNVGYPINTPDDDISFITTQDGERGYFSSVREDGFGYQDIYMFTIPEEIKNITEEEPEFVRLPDTKQPVNITVNVRDENNNLINAKVQIRNKSQNVLAAVRNLSAGKYSASVKNNEPIEYSISIEKDGYVFINRTYTIPASTDKIQTIEYDFVLKKAVAGSRLVLRNIYFDFDRVTLKDESLFEINKLYSMLSENSRLVVEISGHTDNIGTKEYNKDLSYRRARAVVNVLTRKGIDAARIMATGYGEEKPLVSNDDERDGREINRRVEFKVMRFIQ
jgi:outer membrane protein OmpA-like peptidoglycan-associated protein/tetratricopeptide (TPR) repeat protein